MKAFAKRFVEEPGSDTVEAVCAHAIELGLSVLCVPEVISALNRRLRERALTLAQYRQAKQQPAVRPLSGKSSRPDGAPSTQRRGVSLITTVRFLRRDSSESLAKGGSLSPAEVGKMLLRGNP